MLGGLEAMTPLEKCDQPSVFAFVALCLQINHTSGAPVKEPETMHFCLCRVGRRANACFLVSCCSSSMPPTLDPWGKWKKQAIHGSKSSEFPFQFLPVRWPRWPSVPVHSRGKSPIVEDCFLLVIWGNGVDRRGFWVLFCSGVSV